MKFRHWPVFWGSFAVMLVTWGLVPTQAGIFSVRQVTQTVNVNLDLSTSTVPSLEQASTLTFQYAQSTYGIATLNETLPPFMARNYTLGPFELRNTSEVSMQDAGGMAPGTLKAETTMYFTNLYCEDVSHKADNSSRISYVSNSGCKFNLGLNGNLTMGQNPASGKGDVLGIKKYTGMFVGYQDPQGFSDYTLESSCQENQTSGIFYAAFQQNKVGQSDFITIN